MNKPVLFGRISLLALSTLLMACLWGGMALAGGPAPAEAERLARHQISAIERGDYQAFVQYGTRAFKELYYDFSFDSLRMQRQRDLKKGYALEYLGELSQIGMNIHLWKVSIKGEKKDLLAKLSLSNGMVAGFDLE